MDRVDGRARGRWVVGIVATVVLLMLMAPAPKASASQSRTTGSARGKLQWFGGPVVHSSAPYLVYWTPPGWSIAARSQALLARYFTDVAADSGKSSNVFGVLRQYYDRAGFADYKQTFDAARQVIVDTQPYPSEDAKGCPAVSATYPTCISDGQIQAELQRLIVADHLPSAGSAKAAFPKGGFATGGVLAADAPIYFVFLPAGVSVCYSGGCSDKNLGGYHESFTDAQGNVVLYAPIATTCCALGVPPPGVGGPCELGGTPVPQEPDGDIADCFIDGLEHEDAETITDPIPGTPHNGWAQNAFVQGEVGDECGIHGAFDPKGGFNPDAFAPTLGGSEAAGTLYTQLINNHPYYNQSMWSDGDGACEMRPTAGRIVPRFTVGHGPNRAGATLTFDPSASTSKNPLTSATWNFGDGSTPGFYYPDAVRTGSPVLIRAEHRYRRPGRHTVTLTLVDNRGNLKTTTRHMTVHARK
jgi:hypothetical protein